jgi:CDP-paratose 2-epimerase
MTQVRQTELPAPVLITGGAGFIGANLADYLLAQGREVRILDNLARAGTQRNLAWLLGRHAGRLQVVRGDVRDADSVRTALAGVGTVFHFAAQVAVTSSLGNPTQDFAINAAGTLTLLESIRHSGVGPKLVFTSTNKVYGALDDIHLRAGRSRYAPIGALAETGIGENRALSFHSPYGCSKGAADQYVLDYARSYGQANVVLRMSCIYGPHQHGTEDQGWVAHFLIRAADRKLITIFGDGRQVRDLLYVDDLVNGLVRAEQCLPAIAGEAFNIGGGPGSTASLNELIDLITDLHGARPRICYDAWRIGDQRWYVSDFRKFAGATGWQPRVGVADGVRRLHDWLGARPRASAEVQAAAE